jgi:gluconolactonase
VAWEFELVAGPFEGPTAGLAWDGEGLLFSVVLPSHVDSRILRYDPSTGSVSDFRKYSGRTIGLAFSPDGHLYGCQNASRRIVEFHSDGSTTLLTDRIGGRFHNQPKSLVVDQRGRIWFTDPYGELPPVGPQVEGPLDHASVLMLDRYPNRLWYLKRMTYDTTAPSAIQITPDGKTLYVSENGVEPGGTRELRAYPIRDDDTLGPHTVLHLFGSDYRGPHRGIEGMCLDDGSNIVACAGWRRSGPGPMVYVFTPSGQLLESHTVPGDGPMACTFGDSDLRTLYVTTGEGHLYRAQNIGRRGGQLYPPLPSQ